MPVHTSTRAATAAALIVAVVIGPSAAAFAAGRDPANPQDPQGTPTKAQVDKASADVAAKTRKVAQIRASLAVAGQRLADAAEQADAASEEYNGALWRLSLAKKAVAQAEADAASSQLGIATERDGIAQLLTQSYQEGTALDSVTALLGGQGPQGVMRSYGAYKSASDSMQAHYERFQVLAEIAADYEARARAEQAKQAALATDAKKVRQQAADLATYAQEQATRIALQKQQLMSELAAAQDISITLATSREKALESVAKHAQEKAAKARAEAAARQAAKDAAAAIKAAAGSDDPADPTGGLGSYYPQPAPGHAPPVSHGVGRVLSFASQQLGDPYLWAAAGPGSWDCSGLTMMAWRAAGVYLPHYSAAQYAISTPISVVDLRPGDLVFWGATPQTIHHVALYIGNGEILQAPHTGAYVDIANMYSDGAPTFFARPERSVVTG